MRFSISFAAAIIAAALTSAAHAEQPSEATAPSQDEAPSQFDFHAGPSLTYTPKAQGASSGLGWGASAGADWWPTGSWWGLFGDADYSEIEGVAKAIIHDGSSDVGRYVVDTHTTANTHTQFNIAALTVGPSVRAFGFLTLKAGIGYGQADLGTTVDTVTNYTGRYRQTVVSSGIVTKQLKLDASSESLVGKVGGEVELFGLAKALFPQAWQPKNIGLSLGLDGEAGRFRQPHAQGGTITDTWLGVSRATLALEARF